MFDGVKTSRMLSCQAVTIGRDVRGVASLAWGGVRGTGGDWLDACHTACAGLIQRRVPHENAIDRRSPVVWAVNWALKS